MSEMRGVAVVGPVGERRQGVVGISLHIGGSLLTAVGRMIGLAAYWPWAHFRATAAFRRALRQSGLPPAAVARLTQNYAAAGSPRQILRRVLKALR